MLIVEENINEIEKFLENFGKKKRRYKWELWSIEELFYL